MALLRRLAPRTAAVVIDRPTGEGVTLASVMKSVARCVDLKRIGVSVRTTRTTRTGGILLEVDSAEGANTLAEQVRLAVAGKARVTHPERRTPVLLLDVLSWAEEADVTEGLVMAGVISQDVTSVTVRGEREGREGHGYGTAVITVPCTVAIKLAEKGAVVVGWTKCRVRLLEKRPPKCFRCQASGSGMQRPG